MKQLNNQTASLEHGSGVRNNKASLNREGHHTVIKTGTLRIVSVEGHGDDLGVKVLTRARIRDPL
jgi:hypothetical protein